VGIDRKTRAYQESLPLGRDQCRGQLQTDGINGNLDSALFAPAGGALRRREVQLISPLSVGFYDWYKAANSAITPVQRSGAAVSAGIFLLQEVRIQHRSDGRELSHVSRLIELARRTWLTISPELLDKLSKSQEPIERT